MAKTLQEVFAGMTDAEALAVWRVLVRAVENDAAQEDEEHDGDLVTAKPVVDRLDGVIVGSAEPESRDGRWVRARRNVQRW